MNRQAGSRKMSFNDRIYVAADRICPPVVNQMVFDGAGELDLPRWRKAVEVASAANPGSRLVLKGHLGWTRWVDSGVTPRVREDDASSWDGRGSEGAPSSLFDSLPCRESPSCEVVLIRGPVPRVAFRTHHSVMDARGTLTWAEDIFRVLRNEPVIGSTWDMNDVELIKTFQTKMRTPFPTEHIPPGGKPEGDERGVVWRKRAIKGNMKLILPRCARLSAEEAWRHAEGIVRFGIAVDMRRRMPGLRSTSSLAFAFYIEVKPDSTPEMIADDIAAQVESGAEGMLSRGDQLIVHIPIALLARAGDRIIRERNKTGIYSLSGILTNVGRVDLGKFSGGGFNARAFWAVPPNNEYYPFLMVLTGYEGGFELILSMPRNQASGGRIDDVLDRIARGMEQYRKEGR
ncbi:MAG: hypothetical protein JW807_16435 [Spirochaetes bacterium]|nr:hypothetical protein [Spirochaetota bacterium]